VAINTDGCEECAVVSWCVQRCSGEVRLAATCWPASA